MGSRLAGSSGEASAASSALKVTSMQKVCGQRSEDGRPYSCDKRSAASGIESCVLQKA